jgi:hypothetical protein
MIDYKVRQAAPSWQERDKTVKQSIGWLDNSCKKKDSNFSIVMGWIGAYLEQCASRRLYLASRTQDRLDLDIHCGV